MSEEDWFCCEYCGTNWETEDDALDCAEKDQQGKVKEI